MVRDWDIETPCASIIQSRIFGINKRISGIGTNGKADWMARKAKSGQKAQPNGIQATSFFLSRLRLPFAKQRSSLLRVKLGPQPKATERPT
jgi:hypothetical protein